MLLERDGDTIFINLQDKPWQLMQALEAFHVSLLMTVRLYIYTLAVSKVHGV